MPFRENIGGLQSEQELDEQGLEGALVGASPLSNVSTLSQGALPESSLSTVPTTGPLSQSSSALRFDFNKDPTNAANIQNIANQLLTSGKGLVGTQLDPYALEQLGFAKNPVYSQGEGSDTLTNPSVWSADKKLVGYDNEGNPLYENLGTYSTFANAYDVGNKGTLLGQNITVDDTGKIVNVGLGTSQRGSFLESISPLLNMAATVVTGGAAGFGLSPLQALAASTALRTLGGADLETLIRNAAATYGINAGLNMASTEIANAAGLDKNLVNKALRTAYGASQSKNPYDLLSAGIRTLASGTGRDILDEYNVTGGPGTQISALDRLSQVSDTEADIPSDLASRIASASGLNLSGGLDLTSGEQVAALPLLGIPAIQQGIAAASVLGAHGAALWSALQKAQNPGADIPWTMDYATTVPDYANKPVSDWTEADKQAYIKDFQQSIGKYDTKPLFTTPTNQSLTVQSSRVPSDFKYNEFTQSFPYVDEFGDVKYVSKQDLNVDPKLKWLEEIYFPKPITIDTSFNVEDPTKTKTTDSGAQAPSSSQASSEAASLSQALNNALSESQSLESGATAGGTSSGDVQVQGGTVPSGGVPGGAPSGGVPGSVTSEGGDASGGGAPSGGVTSGGGNIPGGVTVGGITPGGVTSGGVTPGGQTLGAGTTGEEGVSGSGGTNAGTGTLTGDGTLKSETLGGGTSGGETSGGSTSGGETLGGETSGGTAAETGTGTSGFSGVSGDSGASGFSGFSGKSGISGFSGFSGLSGDSGFSGVSGESGISGFSGVSGESGASGFSGFSGESGSSGFSGYSGFSGESGFSGVSGESGISGFSGFSGESGTSGFSGASGVSGESGFSGFSGVSGESGSSGFSGTSGLSGFSGASGVSGVSGFSGFSGVSGVSGVSGFSGFSGTAGRDGKAVYAPAAVVSSIAAAPAAIDWLGQRMLESKTRGGYRDPLAEFLALQQDIEKESLLKQLQPELANVLAERNAMPYYSYGQEPPIEDVLGLPGGESSSYNESDYVPMFKAGGKVSPLNIQMMYAKGGHAREDFRDGKHVAGPGDGQSDDIPAWLADGEFVFPADVVSALGNGSTKAGTEKLYDMMHEIRARARSSKEKDLPPPAHKSPLDYLKTKKGK